MYNQNKEIESFLSNNFWAIAIPHFIFQGMIAFFVLFVLFSGVNADWPEVRIPRGLGQAKMPADLMNKDIRLMDMRPGDTVVAFSDALFVDKYGEVWLNPVYRGYDPHSSVAKASNLEIRRTRIGYFVRVPFKYTQINGYSVPRYPVWNSVGNAVPGYIPVVSVKKDVPEYQKRAEQVPEPPPRIRVPANPYSMENKNHVRSFRVIPPDFRPANP